MYGGHLTIEIAHEKVCEHERAVAAILMGEQARQARASQTAEPHLPRLGSLLRLLGRASKQHATLSTMNAELQPSVTEPRIRRIRSAGRRWPMLALGCWSAGSREIPGLITRAGSRARLDPDR